MPRATPENFNDASAPVLEAQIREISPTNYKWRVVNLRPKSFEGYPITDGTAETYKQACAAAGEAMNTYKCKEQP